MSHTHDVPTCEKKRKEKRRSASHTKRTHRRQSLLCSRDPRSGCGTSFEVSVVSKQFQGKPALARHRLVHGALGDTMANIHALSIKKTQTPEQAASAP